MRLRGLLVQHNTRTVCACAGNHSCNFAVIRLLAFRERSVFVDHNQRSGINHLAADGIKLLGTIGAGQKDVASDSHFAVDLDVAVKKSCVSAARSVYSFSSPL